MDSKQTDQPFPIVGIGASAGGIQAISSLLQHLPARTGAAFVVVLHLDPDRVSHLGEVLGRQTRMRTIEIEDCMPIEQDRVYVVAPDRDVVIEEARFRLKTPTQPCAMRRPVDELFRSLALAAGPRAVAVIMSGTGTNGSAALAEIKANGGVVLAQDPASAAFSGMPANAIDTGLVDQVLEPERMAETIVEYINSAYVAAAEKGWQTKLDELETTSNNLANLLNSSDIATLFLSRDMTVKWFTPAVSRLFSLINTDIGRPITDFAQKFIDGDILQDCQRVLTTLVPVKTEIQDQRGQWYLRRAAPYRTSDDKIDGVVISFVDIADAKQYERKLRRAAAKARKAAAAKDDFLARLSHELRTPLHPALLGLSGLASRTDLPAEVAEKIASITRNIEIEVRLIDDLLDLTRVRQGQLHLDREQVDTLDLINESVQLCRDDSAEKQLNIVVHGTPRHCMVDVDKLRLQQVMWNLLRNAIRFTREHGTIELRCERRDSRVMLEVKDDGAGITPPLLPRVFESFERSDEAFSGLGLGLSIAKSFVEAHGGTIEAESPGSGKGSTFRVWLPADEAAPAEAAEEGLVGIDRSGEGASARNTELDLAGLNILLVEDHPDSAEMLASLLQALGCRTRTAGTVQEARTAISEESFDLLLSDLALPDGTGHELMAELHGGIPAIALSGLGSPQDQQRSAKAGFKAHLVKPLTLSKLTTAIEEAVHGADVRTASVLH